jgi:hypothetical protein
LHERKHPRSHDGGKPILKFAGNFAEVMTRNSNSLSGVIICPYESWLGSG